MPIKFKSIALHDWRQFQAISIEVHPRLTVLTGSNGAGKSTILNLFSQHFGISRPFLSTPKRTKSGAIIYDLGYYEKPQSETFDAGFTDVLSTLEEDQDIDEPDEQPLIARPQGTFISIGTISYDNESSGLLGFHEQQTSAYGISIQGQQPVPGLHISSHRTISAYQPVQGLSLQALAISQAYASYFNELNARMSGGNTQFSPIYRMKETLIAMAAFGEGNSHLESNSELTAAFTGFVSVLKKVLPKELGFQKLIVRLPDILLKTKSGEFILDSSSGGVNAVIEIAWQIYLFSLNNAEFVATIDEPENHLHPSMQRSILSNLIATFPRVQFIVATHSPFIVSAVEDSYVYALKYIQSNRQNYLPGRRQVKSIHLDQTSKAGTASDILREVLGVNVTIPDWAQNKLDQIVVRYIGAEVNVEMLASLRQDLLKEGFSEFYPGSIVEAGANKVIRLTKLEEPDVLVTHAASWLEAVQARLSQGESPTQYEKSRYRHPEIKTRLREETFGKCAYCESKILHVSYGDVEHVIPKSLDLDQLFRWENLTLACDVCNTNKGNVSSLIDPYNDDLDGAFLFFGPMIFPKATNPRALLTERQLRLNRGDLIERRAERLKRVSDLIALVEAVSDPAVKRVLREDLVTNEVAADAEYSAFVKSLLVALS